MLEVIPALGFGELVEDSTAEFPELIDRSFRPVAQELFQLGECQLDGIQIGRVGRQVAQFGTDRFDRFADSSHKVVGIREAIEAAGAELRYLPPYSPDLNPIELAFSKLKKLLRDGAERTVDKLWELCGRILDQFTEPECRNYFKHCGYRYT